MTLVVVPTAMSFYAAAMSGFFTPDTGHAPTGRDAQSGEMQALHEALEALQATAAHFGTTGQTDARVRMEYQAMTRKAAQDLLAAVQRGEMTPAQAAEQAQTLRNSAMEMMRARTSPTMLAYAKSLKEQGKTLAELCEKYAGELYAKPFAKLGEAEQAAVWLRIIQKSGQPNAAVSRQAMGLRYAGRALFVLSLAIAVSDIMNAEDKPREVAHQGSLMAAGVAGGYLAGAGAVSLGVCAATAPVCIGAAAIVGAMALAFGTDWAFSSLWPKPARR